MLQQTDYVFRLLEYSPIDPNKSTDYWSAWIRDTYLTRGYQVLSSEVVRTEANSVFVGIHFVKYEEVNPILTESATDSIGDTSTKKNK